MLVNCLTQQQTCSAENSPQNAFHEKEEEEEENETFANKTLNIIHPLLLISLFNKPIWTPKAQINYFVQINTTLKWMCEWKSAYNSEIIRALSYHKIICGKISLRPEVDNQFSRT